MQAVVHLVWWSLLLAPGCAGWGMGDGATYINVHDLHIYTLLQQQSVPERGAQRARFDTL